MANMAQIDRILSEVNELEEKEKILFYHKIGEIFDNSNDQQDDDIPIESVFGLWKNRNITKETLREKAWTKNGITY
jgi:TnpA family transposase